MADNKLQTEFQNVQKDKLTLEKNLKQMNDDLSKIEGKIREQESDKKRTEDKLAELTRDRDALTAKKEDSERRLADHQKNLDQIRQDLVRMEEDAKK